ncbi:phytochromobilin:ferredoxin oxidoreductase, chloroplastic isoform X2 [Iris pallida]|uniref:Phytochromobilin:ferredoxin oxidoreductase, chloroplastic isoform X2 n=1 Tax=Iris pallida TaxID=29817 RepID=A0AAX6F7E8_IRIPA|nr:phytochromobilin:ferredoxin oxidoreductase, chloroplastic isoform X2 [Iris pallida]KAJ6838435.1 phytochromobilin:ferredoxin oxidoreductase, chloroplastic isoform X2 [Iris pallida]
MELFSNFSYQKFAKFALEEARLRTALTPHPSQERFKKLEPNDGKTLIHALSFRAPKTRLLRSLTIEGTPTMQVLDFAALPEPNFDLPIFCANFFTTPRLSIVVLDLNPLYDVSIQKDYKEKYYRKLMPLGNKYSKFKIKIMQLLPWGDKITSESLRFFSPIVIWTKFSLSQYKHDILYSAFKEYFKAWLQLMDQAVEETDASRILQNREAQHKYLTWRAEKDPGHPILKRVIGEDLARDVVRDFLFEGVDTLGDESFLDYFPEYRCEDGTINKKRSMMGKSYEVRPWDANGEFIGNEP